MSRRDFLACSCSCAAAIIGSGIDPQKTFGWTITRPSVESGASDIRGTIFKNDAPDKLWKYHKEGFSYARMADNKVMCRICPNRCVLSPGDRSVCRSKVNMDGTLYSLVYGNPCAVNVDPIEKKPLFHFRPQSTAFSLATTGCSFRCLNCQNWEISQAKPHEVEFYELFPDSVIEEARKAGCHSIAYTYTEATTYFEYMVDTARLAKQAGLNNIWVSNGSINRKPLRELCKVINAANVNLKSFDDAIYRKLNGGRLQPILNTFKTLYENNIHFEMTNLVVPGYVDDPEMLKRMCGWILENLGPDHPLHFLRFFPLYKLKRLSPTPQSTLEKFREIAMNEGIHYAYVGNIPGHPGANTYCHECGNLLIERRGYSMPTYNLKGDYCTFCNTRIPGVWKGAPTETDENNKS